MLCVELQQTKKIYTLGEPHTQLSSINTRKTSGAPFFLKYKCAGASTQLIYQGWCLGSRERPLFNTFVGRIQEVKALPR